MDMTAGGGDLAGMAVKFLGVILGLTCGLYLYFGIVLTLLAKKTSTSNAALAWLPIANAFLLCMIARRSMATFLLLLIPIVNLIAGVVLWMSIAENRGKPSWLGALVFFPVIGLLVPFFLIAGPATNPDESVGPSACPNCGAAAAPGDTFCGECGTPIASTPRRTRRTPALQLAAVGTVLVALILGASSFGSWAVMGKMLAYSPPKQERPALAKRMAGVMTEFPIDTDKENPAKPESLIAESYKPGGSASDVKVPEKWLPKGVDRSRIPSRVRTLSAARYRRKSARSPVSVAVMEPQPGVKNLGKTLAADIRGASGGETTGVKVENPEGATYVGTRTQTATEQIYVLDGTDTGTTIIVYADDPAEWTTADRLAQNVGNGDGLLEAPEEEVLNPLWVLPAELPPGFELEGIESMTIDDFMRTSEAREAERAAASDAEIARAWEAFRQILPDRWTVASYSDGSGGKWKAAVLDYTETRRSWLIWQIFKPMLAGASFASVEVRDSEGRAGTGDGKSWLYFQKGPYIGWVEGPSGAGQSGVLGLGDRFQL